LWGFTAILGKLISIGAIALVWYRIALVVLMMGAVVAWKRLGFGLSRAQALRYLGVGALIAAHWLCFYGCIKYAGVAIAVLCLSSVGFFTALLEPLIFKRPVRRYELVLGLGVVLGVALLVQLEAKTDALGMALGLGSSLFSAAFGTLNGKLTLEDRAERITFFELSFALAVTSLFFFPSQWISPLALSAADLLWLVLLAVACTVFPWQWSLKVVKTLSPYTVALAVTLEPVYSMLLAFVIFPGTEQLSLRFYLGAAALVALVLANARLKRLFT
jgi:drug/metabolite transporter (DMT)-like permease